MKPLDAPKRSDLSKYGLTQHDFDVLWFTVNGHCPLCHKAFTKDRRRPAAIDHDHKTGEVRGLICRQCNVRLGILHENADWMFAAANYLRAKGRHVRAVLGSARYVKDAPPR